MGGARRLSRGLAEHRLDHSPVVDLAGAELGRHHSVAQDGDPIGELLHLVEVVAHEHQPGSLGTQLAEHRRQAT